MAFTPAPRRKINRMRLPDGTLILWPLERIPSARERAILAESYLRHPESLASLRRRHKHRTIVLDYLEQSLEADMGLTDPPRFRALMRGATEFYCLGLHRLKRVADFLDEGPLLG